MSTQIWKFLNTDIKDLISLDSVDGTVDTAQATLELAKTIQEQDIKDLAPWIEQGASLLDVLNTPEVELTGAILPFAKVVTGLLRFYLKKNQQKLSFS